MPERFAKFYERILEGGVILLLFLPVIGEYGPLLYPLGRDILLWVVVEIMAGSFLLLMLAKRHTPLPRFSWIIFFFFAWWGATGIATLFSPHQSLSFWGSIIRSQGLFTFSHFLILFLILAAFFPKEKWRNKFFPAMVLASIFVSSLALWERVSAGTERVSSTLGNPNFLAGYLLLIIFATLAFFLQEKRYPLKIFYGSSLALQAITLVLTFSRGAYLGFFGGLLIFFFLLPGLQKKLRVATLGGIAAFLILGGLLQISHQTEWVRAISPQIYERFFSTSNQGIPYTIISRTESWHAGIQGIAARPFFGWGPENFAIPFDAFYRGNLEHIYFGEAWFDRAHNIFIDVAATTGIVGLMAFLALLLSILIKTVRIRFSSPDPASQFFGGRARCCFRCVYRQ